MTIDEYLNQLKKLDRRTDRLAAKYKELEERATSPRSSFNFGSDVHKCGSGRNITEDRITAAADALLAYRRSLDEYIRAREELMQNIYNMIYWQGLIIERVYIYNINAADDLVGIGEILNTKSRGVILEKLDEAKQNLRRILIDQGIDIE